MLVSTPVSKQVIFMLIALNLLQVAWVRWYTAPHDITIVGEEDFDIILD